MKKVLFLSVLLVAALAVAAVVSNIPSVKAQVVPAGSAEAASAIEAAPVGVSVPLPSMDTAIPAGVEAVGGGQNPNSGAGASQGSGLLLTAAGDLSPEEADALLFMVEEEKLARDVYNTLYSVWGLSTFQNIARSEQAHVDALTVLLDRYGLASPVQAAAGAFTDSDLQALYDQLVERGGQSLTEALKVGGAVEEIDILDLQSRLALTDNADIQRVFTNLLRGSENHLRAYARALLQQTGETYVPQYMSQEAFDTIMAGTAGNYGNGRGGQGGGGGGRGGRGGRP